MFPYQIANLKRTLFSANAGGEVPPNEAGWTSELLDWSDSSLQETKRKLVPTAGWNFLQGNKKVQGRLLGGCLEALKSTAF